MHAQHMDIILIFARTRDVGLCRPCLHEKKTDMEQFGKILIVDDNEDVLFALNLLLEPYAEKIKVAVTPDRIEHFMTTFRPDIILLDMNFSRDAISGQEGFDSLKQILSIDPQAVVIFMTAYADTDKAVRAIKAGATDFIPKPWEKEKLLATLSSGMKLRRSRTEINLLKEQVEVLSNATAGGSEEIIIGDSPVMQQVFSTVEKLRDTDANILLMGENGTGKDVIARMLYRNSPRYGKPFVTIDLGSIPEQLFESELFGYEKGAFTGADTAKNGYFDMAKGGTLFLDEIGTMPIDIQSMLLRVLQENTYTPIGSDRERMADVRIVAATNENLERAIKEGRFREDLYHRLAEMEIRMPSLAECADDILPLAEFFRERFSKELKKETKGFSKDAIYRLRSYRWPGNVRELQSRIKRAVLLTETPVLELPDLNADSQTDIRITEKTPDILPLKDENSEREAIANALQACNGHREQTARLLNVNSSTLYRKMKKYGIR